MLKKIVLISIFCIGNITWTSPIYYYDLNPKKPRIVELKGIKSIEKREDFIDETKQVKIPILKLSKPITIKIHPDDKDDGFTDTEIIQELQIINKTIPNGCVIVKGTLNHSSHGETNTLVYLNAFSFKPCN